MDWGKRGPQVRAGLVVIAVALAVGLLSAPASGATTPNLTGSWVNVATPTLPAWAFQAGANLSQLSVQWHGSAASGHPTLAGSFTGILNLARTTYSGRYLVTEGGASFPGDMTITIVSPNRVTISLQGDNGSSATYTFVRAPGAAAPPPSSWCTGGTIGPACQTGPITLAAAVGGIVASPDLTAGQNVATISVSESGDSPDNVVSVAGAILGERQAGKHAADCVPEAEHTAARYAPGKVALGPAGDFDALATNLTFVYALLSCLDDLHKAQAQATTAQVASASCPVKPFRINFHVSGNTVAYTPKKGPVTPPVSITCVRTSTGLTVHLKTRSRRTSLKSVFGRRLLLGVYHSAKASRFATVTAGFRNH